MSPQKQQTEVVPVDPIDKSTRGWLNIGIGFLGAVLTSEPAQRLIASNPYLAGASLVVTGAINYFLTRRSKKGVVSKNVLIEQ